MSKVIIAPTERAMYNLGAVLRDLIVGMGLSPPIPQFLQITQARKLLILMVLDRSHHWPTPYP